jgi:hypothetical protein
MLLAGASLCANACGGGDVYGPTTSDKNFDDPDDPGASGNTGTAPDANVGDAQGRACAADRDCPAAYRCAFPVASGCASKGSCVLFSPPAGCEQKIACACDGTKATFCAPDGYASAPIKAVGPCTGDASIPDTSAPETSTSDAAGD